MSWIRYVNYHKEFLLRYFTHGCRRCIYNKYTELNYSNEFAMIYNGTKPHDIQDYDRENLCDDCVLDKPRALYDVVFTIIKEILETHKIGDFILSLEILNKSNIVIKPREVLLKYYIEKCKEEKTLEPYCGYIHKILRSGDIDPKYNFSKVIPAPCPKLFIFNTINAINRINFNQRFKNDYINKKIISLLNLHEIPIFYADNKGVLQITNIGRFILFT